MMPVGWFDRRKVQGKTDLGLSDHTRQPVATPDAAALLLVLESGPFTVVGRGGLWVKLRV